MTKPIYKAKRPGYRIEVYDNRLVVKKKKLFGWKENNIPWSNNKIKQQIEIETENETYKIAAGIGAQKIVDNILENMK